MKTILFENKCIPEFDTHINSLLELFEHETSNITQCIGIADFISGQYVIYRRIEATNGDLKCLIYRLHEIDMIDMIVKQKDKDFGRILGYPRNYYP